MLDKGIEAPEKENKNFVGWVVKDTKIAHEDLTVYHDLTFEAIYEDVPEANENNDNSTDNNNQNETPNNVKSIVLVIVCLSAVSVLVIGTIIVTIRSFKKK